MCRGRMGLGFLCFWSGLVKVLFSEPTAQGYDLGFIIAMLTHLASPLSACDTCDTFKACSSSEKGRAQSYLLLPSSTQQSQQWETLMCSGLLGLERWHPVLMALGMWGCGPCQGWAFLCFWLVNPFFFTSLCHRKKAASDFCLKTKAVIMHTFFTQLLVQCSGAILSLWLYLKVGVPLHPFSCWRVGLADNPLPQAHGISLRLAKHQTSSGAWRCRPRCFWNVISDWEPNLSRPWLADCSGLAKEENVG